jgi:hypothetical protein
MPDLVDPRTIAVLVDEIAADVGIMQQRMLETWRRAESREEWFTTWREVLTALETRAVADASTIALARATLTWFEAHLSEMLGELRGRDHADGVADARA